MSKENPQFKRCLRSLKGSNLDTLFEEISVLPCGDMLDNFPTGSKLRRLNRLLKGWYAVANTDGVIAYFGEEKEAYRFRLDYINRIINN